MSIFLATPSLRVLNKSAALPRWPQDCVLCVAPATDALCGECERELPWLGPACPRCALPLAPGTRCVSCTVHPPRFDAARACFAYRFPLDRLVQRFKYGGDLAIGRWLAERLAERVHDAQRPDLLVVPPLGAARLRERGFNQALEIARTVGRSLGVPVDARAVARRRDTPPQARLDRRARAANLRGAFACGTALRDRRVAIVDDVLTTGATADAIARVVKAAGAERVSVWAVARAPDPGGR